MKPFSLTLPLALGTALGLVAAVVAGPADAYTNPHNTIVETIQDSGYRIYGEHTECTKDQGLKGFMNPMSRVFVVCFENAATATEIYTTIRHEAIHVAQLCKGGLLFPQDVELNLSRAQDEGWDILGYPTSHWEVEAEARVMANEWDAHEVNAAIRKFCF